MSQSPKSTLWKTLDNSILVRYLLLIACGWTLIVSINYFYDVIATFTAAAIIATLLNYPTRWLSRYMPRGLAIVIVFLSSIAILVSLITSLGMEVINQGQALVTQIADGLQNQNLPPLQASFFSDLKLDKLIETLQTGLISGLGILQNIFSSLFTLIFVAAIAVYMLIDGSNFWSACLKLVPVKFRDRFASTFQKSFLGFLRGQIILMVFLSIASCLIFSILGVRYALLLSLIVGILDAIPGIGATLGVLAITLLVLGSQGLAVAAKVAIASIILQQIQDNFVRTKVMGENVEISPIMLFFALFIGERIAGLLGVFLSIPIAGMIAAWLRAEELEAKELEAKELQTEASIIKS